MEVIICIMMFIMGACLGSFYACMGYRIPNKISTVKPSSFCPNCKKPLKWYMNIPLVSYLLLKRKCAFCSKKISPMYFVIELFTALAFMLSYIYYGFSMDLFIVLVLISALSVTIVTDFISYYISDRVLVISGLLILSIKFYYLGFTNSLTYIVSAFIMLIFMLIIKLIGDKVFKRESLGGGDIKLMFLIGLTLGLVESIFSLFISSVLALIASLLVMKKNEEGIIPFGPFLILGTIIVYIFYTV